MPAPMSHRDQGGFVLVIVLALLVVLTLMAAAVATSGSRAVAEAQAEVDRFQGEMDMQSTGETVMFMLATQRRNLGGLMVDASAPVTLEMLDDDGGSRVIPLGNEIRLDSSAYAGLGDAVFAVQDDRGLLSPNWATESMRSAFYAARGAAPGEWSGLEAKRLDYQDPDSLHRLAGAEKDHYEKQGLPPPSSTNTTASSGVRPFEKIEPTW